MGKRIFLILIIAALIMSFGAMSFAAQTKQLVVKAVVPTQAQSLRLMVMRVDSKNTEIPDDDTFEAPVENRAVDFGTVTADTTDNIYRARFYFAVDCAVLDNSGNNWTLTQTKTPVQKDALNNIDSNINVVFVKMIKNPDGTETQTELVKKSYANSGGQAHTRDQLKTGSLQGWLRIIYGLATGTPATDAPGVVPLPLDKPSGTYQGAVTLTLTP